MPKNIIKSRLRRFASETEGYITVEAVIVFPALLFLFCACWVYFDVLRQQAINQKGNYTIGDAISRETDPITPRYVDNARNLLYMLNKSEGNETDLRITAVKYNAQHDKYQVVWSQTRGDYPPLANNMMKNYTNRLPIMANNDQVIVVESWDDYNPIFQVGLDAFEIQTYSFTRPRYAPQVLFDAGENNGWGNGDQVAPGGSECTNNAENWDQCTNEDGSQNIEPASNGNSGI